jgi:hypothetical protein
MELSLTKEQQDYLNKSGPIKAAALQRIYKKSVQDQQKTLREAKEIRAKRKQSSK